MDEGKKKPLKGKSRHYPGMKKQPELGRKKLPKKKYGPFSHNGKIKPGMTDFQKRTMNEFLKVREGETVKEWQRRTARRRVKEIDEIRELSLMNPIRVFQRNRERDAITQRNKYIKVQPMEREFDFMRYYGIVSNYYSIKHGIRKEDIEVGFYFYSNIPFTRDRFENAMILMTGTKTGKFMRWLRDGLLEELTQTKKVFNAPNKIVKTNLYRLPRVFVDKLTHLYRTLGMMNTINMNNPVLTILSPQEKQMIKDMNDHIMDIQTGRKPQDLIKPNK
jgi:hypothetical protein